MFPKPSVELVIFVAILVSVLALIAAKIPGARREEETDSEYESSGRNAGWGFLVLLGAICVGWAIFIAWATGRMN